MKRKVLFSFGLGVLVVGGILIHGGVEKADSNLMSGYTRVQGYVYCDNQDPCAGAFVLFEEIDGQTTYKDTTDSNGYFDLGYIVTDDYWANAYCGTGVGRYAGCSYITVGIGGCSEEGDCEEDSTVQANGCEISFYTSQTVCPASE